ncbi:MAG: glutathione transferase GstA [Burkholderiaceae bacterium]|jgi:glutathione S-transferase|nr:glutathione transferase GstA [Burkholderiaceae bacterium]
MKLYYAPGACSLSPHIVLEESGLSYEAIAVALPEHRLADGTDYRQINPLGYVPYLVLDDGTGLREGAAIVQYIADQVPAKKLAPPNGTLARYQVQGWLNFIATELHKTASPLFKPDTPEGIQTATRQALQARLTWVNAQLQGRNYLMGEDFSVPDAYLFVVTNWTKIGIDLAPLTHLTAFRARMAARPAVQAAMKAEGLIG